MSHRNKASQYNWSFHLSNAMTFWKMYGLMQFSWKSYLCCGRYFQWCHFKMAATIGYDQDRSRLVKGHLRKWHGGHIIIFGQDFKVHTFCVTLHDLEHELNAFPFTNFAQRIRRFQLPFLKMTEKLTSFSYYNITKTSTNTVQISLTYLLLHLCSLTCYKAKLFTKKYTRKLLRFDFWPFQTTPQFAL